MGQSEVLNLKESHKAEVLGLKSDLEKGDEYGKQLQTDISDLKIELENLRSGKDLSTERLLLEQKNVQLTSDNTDLEKQSEVVKEEIKKLKQARGELTSEISSLEGTRNTAQNEMN